MTITCPCCRRQVGERKIRRIASLLPFDGFAMPYRPNLTYAEVLFAILSRFSQLYQWACDDCVNGRKAILADPDEQFYTFNHPMDTAMPYLAYFDQERKCKNCGRDFVFSKEAQQFWYEELQFVVYSKPKNCPECRKSDREARDLNTELSDLLQDGKPDNPDELERIAEIYGMMGKLEKQKTYARAANKLRKQK